MMRNAIILLLVFYSTFGFAQKTLQGKIIDKKGDPIFAANVYPESHPELGTSTDFDGHFNLPLKESHPILIISFIGYETKKIKLNLETLSDKEITITLKEDSKLLSELIVLSGDPVSEKFSVTKIKKHDVYFNPVAQGDALKAITIMPASTTIDETANPSLRGSSGDRTRITLNGVPIYTPVRSSQLNNQGFFSLFSTEMIDKQYVYASNPPLTYGNTSAGLVEIQTLRNLPKNQYQASLSIGATGFFISQQLKANEKNFIQLYGNYKNSEAFVGMQKKYLPYLKSFRSKDLGLNIHHKIGKKATLNSFSYIINEAFDVHINMLNYSGKANPKKKRFFSVNNINYYTSKGILSLNTGFNISEQSLNLGNISSNNKVKQLYASLNFKTHITDKLKVQTGISYDYQANNFNDTIPKYSFAFYPNAPTRISKKHLENLMPDIYIYTDYELSDKLSLSAGVRSNIATKNKKEHLNTQVGLKYHLDKKQSILLSGGNYGSYSIPNYYNKEFILLKSFQVACDYKLQIKKIGFKAAAYYKKEQGKQFLNSYLSIDKIQTFGIEAYLEYLLSDQFKLTASNLYINQKLHQKDIKFNGKYDFLYLSKFAIQYNNSKWFSASISYITHPGSYYTPIERVITKPQLDYAIPVFSKNINSKQLQTYNKIDLAINRYTPLKNGSAIIPFLSVTNILNTKNESSAYYSKDYKKQYFNTYGNRIIYFGVIWEL